MCIRDSLNAVFMHSTHMAARLSGNNANTSMHINDILWIAKYMSHIGQHFTLPCLQCVLTNNFFSVQLY